MSPLILHKPAPLPGNGGSRTEGGGKAPLNEIIDSAHPLLQQERERLGFICDYFPTYARDDYRSVIHHYAGVIIRSKIKFDAAILEKAGNLLFIGRVGAGMENIDAVYAAAHGIVCLNAPEGNRDAVGEHALGMLRMLLNNLRRADAQVRQGIWLRAENRGIEIMGKTIGITRTKE